MNRLNLMTSDEAINELKKSFSISENTKFNWKDREIPEEYSDLFLDIDRSISINDVILSEENLNKITQFIKEFNYRDRLKSVGLKPKNKLLFYGATGCGKTMLAKALAVYLGYTMLMVNISRLSTDTALQNLRRVFNLASSEEGYLIFLDECDNIAFTRESNKGKLDELKVIEFLFQLIDKMNPDTILVCATNLSSKLDSAFKRRFNDLLQFQNPKGDFIEIIARFLINGFEIYDDMLESDKVLIYNRCNIGYSAIEEIVNSEMKRAVIKGTNVIKLSSVLTKMTRDTAVDLSKKYEEG